MYEHFETERLIIEPLTINDFSFLLELLNSDGWIKYIGERNIKDDESAKAYIQKILESKSYYNVFKLKKHLQPIGIVTFIYRETHNFPDIGFAILPDYEKKGYAYEAVKSYLEKIVSIQKQEKIIAITLPENYNSIKLLERLGLNFECNFVENNEKLSLYSIQL